MNPVALRFVSQNLVSIADTLVTRFHDAHFDEASSSFLRLSVRCLDIPMYLLPSHDVVLLSRWTLLLATELSFPGQQGAKESKRDRRRGWNRKVQTIWMSYSYSY